MPCFTNPVKPGPLSGLSTIVCSVNTDAPFRVLIRAAEYFSVNETISQQEKNSCAFKQKNLQLLSVILTNQKPKLFELFSEYELSENLNKLQIRLTFSFRFVNFDLFPRGYITA